MLYIVPTPIGNLEDITLRALRILKEADAIYCEDTRHTGMLMAHYQIDKALFSYHAHNERMRIAEMVQKVKEGKTIAVVSDAGMPGISDPGKLIIEAAIEENIPYTVLPGASAAGTAYVASGLGEGEYLFLGFLPRKASLKEEIFVFLDTFPYAAVLYEAPHRIKRTLSEMGKRWPERRMGTYRELTKKFETYTRFLGKEVSSLAIEERGEYVIVLEGASEKVWQKSDVLHLMEKLAAEGLRGKDLLEHVQKMTNWKKNDLYAMQLAMKNEL